MHFNAPRDRLVVYIRNLELGVIREFVDNKRRTFFASNTVDNFQPLLENCN